jgi:hypothetical protein
VSASIVEADELTASARDLANEQLDRRFSVRPEYCGYRARRYVARFCGEWIGEARTRSEARALAHSWRGRRF